MESAITRSRASASPDPKNILAALRVLGIVIRRRDFPRVDRDHLLYDARAAFRSAVRDAHPDRGGTADATRPLLVAFRIVKRYCQPPTWHPPRDRNAEAARLARDQL